MLFECLNKRQIEMMLLISDNTEIISFSIAIYICSFENKLACLFVNSTKKMLDEEIDTTLTDMFSSLHENNISF